MGVLILFGYLTATLGAYSFYGAVRFLYPQWVSRLKVLPGPPSSSFLYGNMQEVWEEENAGLHEQWVEQYGTTLTYRVFLGINRLYTTDLKALNYVLMNSYNFQKPEPARYNLSQILGAGVLVVEGDKHKQQRRIMNPAFGAAQIRELTEIFIEKSVELRDIWAEESAKQGGTGNINALSWLSKMTLDVIGLAGFNYKFDALTSDPQKNELNQAFAQLFSAGVSMTLVSLLRGLVPTLRWLPADRDSEIQTARTTMNRIGKQLLRESKAEILKSGNGKVDKSSLKSRDLLSLLLRANMATDLPDNQRMSDEDVLAQVPTFLVAGHETTSAATTWALYALTQDLRVQTELRNELLTVDTDNPTMDDLNALPYLDAVLRETLRLHAPVGFTIRIAMKDDVLPLDMPFTDRHGKVHDTIAVEKGQTIFIPILALNRAKSIWGEDAHEPERWESVPEAAAGIPGVWGNMLTFLGGPRACIGYRFSLIEMKALLFTLVRAFEFELAVPPEDILKKSTIVQRPVLRSNPKAGGQMPLLIRPYNDRN